MLRYKKGVLAISEFLFDESVIAASADIVRYRFRPEPIPGVRCVESYTLRIDLQAEPTLLLARMNHTTQYEIRRAEREELTYEFASIPDKDWKKQFFQFLASFGKPKGLTTADRAWISALLDQKLLDLSRIWSPTTGRALVWHAYIRAAKTARLTHSASLFRERNSAYLGRAHRLHHWCDMLRFREEGLTTYDFGGWYPGTHDSGLLGINRFKQGFGGRIAREYNGDLALTWKGDMALRLRLAARAVGPRSQRSSSTPAHCRSGPGCATLTALSSDDILPEALP